MSNNTIATTSASIASATTTSTNSVVAQLQSNLNTASENMSILTTLRRLEWISDKMISILEICRDQTDYKLILEGLNEYATIGKDYIDTSRELPKEYFDIIDTKTREEIGTLTTIEDVISSLEFQNGLYNDILDEIVNK